LILVTNRPADESFTVQVCTGDIDDVELGSGFELEIATGRIPFMHTLSMLCTPKHAPIHINM